MENQQQREEPKFLGVNDQDLLKEIGSKIQLNTEENTMDFIDRIVNNKEPKQEKNFNQENYAEKLDDFNFQFPKLAPYEGIQTNLNQFENQFSLKGNNN